MLPSPVPPFRASGPELEVSIEDEEWREFMNTNPMVVGLRMKVRVTNRTPKDQRLGPSEIRVSKDGISPWAVEDLTAERSFAAWIHSKPELRSAIDPRDSITGWFALAFKRTPEGGRPAYTFTVRDGSGNRYVIDVPERPPEIYSG